MTGVSAGQRRGRPSPRTIAGWLGTGLAGLLVWLALVIPDQPDRLTPLAFVRLPVEGLALVGLGLVLRGRARRVVAVLAGLVLGLLVVLKALDLGFGTALDRPFNLVADWGYFDSAVGLLADSVGHRQAVLILLGLGALAIALLVAVPLAMLRLARVADRHRIGTVRVGVALGLVWLNCAVLGVQFVTGTPVAASDAARLAWDRAGQAGADLRDEAAFARAAKIDPLRDTPAQDLLTGLRGKDVLIAFVESYGRVAVQDSAFSPGVDAVLDSGTDRLRAAGFCTRSAFLTSPTFGGISWLAHSTLQSGLWVDNQLRYDRLVASDRSTLSVAFGRAGWRTVSDIPANERDWPEGSMFYHYDQRYDGTNVGYAGPKFGYATVPDQYTLAELQRRELAPADRRPVMAEIDLVSSHTPWTPLPRMVGWNAVGDGSVFDPMPAQGPSTAQVWPDQGRVRTAYGASIQYSLTALVSFVQTYATDNTVLIVLGDHQPATIVSGSNAGHDVPISIIARDPAVLDRISGWGWQDGLRPRPDAPVWPMDAFRDRFLSAYGPQPATASAKAATSCGG